MMVYFYYRIVKSIIIILDFILSFSQQTYSYSEGNTSVFLFIVPSNIGGTEISGINITFQHTETCKFIPFVWNSM